MSGLTRRDLMFRAAAAFTASVALALAISVLPREAAAQAAPSLVDLSGPEAFKKQFNEDRGHVRLVLLLSPT